MARPLEAFNPKTAHSMHRFAFDAMTRRDALRGMGASALLSKWPWLEQARPVEETSYLAVAQAAERWIARAAIRSGTGTTWPVDPSAPEQVQRNLYSGTPGVVLFYLELYHATRDQRYLDEAVAGARDLANQVRAASAKDAFGGEGAGLYTGLAGLAYTLDRVHAASSIPQLGQDAADAIRLLHSLQLPNGSWSESNDIISGTAGIGLTLLWAAQALGANEMHEVAAKAGRRLLATKLERPGGYSWGISPTVPRRYPNFSHGAGGVSYFLASLYSVTQERAFLDAAVKGAEYLQSVATTTANGGQMIFHSEPGNEKLYYLSWCHGPAGTARLFHRLGDVTRDARWIAFADRLTMAAGDMGVPEKRSDGFWNNISQCCGNCGVAEYHIALYDRTGDTRQLEYAARVLADVQSRGTVEGDGMKWVQAEHRVRPELLIAQTGLMQGAAGVGLALLHLDGALKRRAPAIVLPDSPYFARHQAG